MSDIPVKDTGGMRWVEEPQTRPPDISMPRWWRKVIDESKAPALAFDIEHEKLMREKFWPHMNDILVAAHRPLCVVRYFNNREPFCSSSMLHSLLDYEVPRDDGDRVFFRLFLEEHGWSRRGRMPLDEVIAFTLQFEYSADDFGNRRMKQLVRALRQLDKLWQKSYSSDQSYDKEV